MKPLHKLALVALAAASFVAAFAGTSLAAGAAEPTGGSLLDLLTPLRDAFAHGRYAYAGSIALVAACALARRYGGARFPFLHTARGSMLLVLLGSLGATLTARLADPSATLTLPLFWDAFAIGVGAAGGYAAIRELVFLPLLKPLAARFPALKALTWLFEHPSDTGPEPVVLKFPPPDAP